jgi:hypothetical protein
MYPRSSRSFCPRLHVLHHNVEQTDEWKQASAIVEPLKQRIISEVFHNSGVPIPPNKDFWVGLHNTTLILEKHNFSLPPTLAQNIGSERNFSLFDL